MLDNLRNVCTRLKKLKTTENFKLLICVKNMNQKMKRPVISKKIQEYLKTPMSTEGGYWRDDSLLNSVIFLKSLPLLFTVSFPVLVTMTYRCNEGHIHPMNVTDVPRTTMDISRNDSGIL